MNVVILIGRLTGDPDIRAAQDGRKIARYTLAVDRRKQGEADFIRCVAFENQADFAEKHLTKGVKIAVTGRIQTGSYTDRDGKKVYTTDIIADRHEFVEPKRTDSAPMQNQPVNNTGFEDVPDGFGGLPFN